MQFINDDIDQLFRRAAEEYPLNTNSADWSKVQKALQNNNNRKRKRGGFFLIFFLTAALWSANTFVSYIENKSNRSSSIMEKEINSFNVHKPGTSDQTIPENPSGNNSGQIDLVHKNTTTNQLLTLKSQTSDHLKYGRSGHVANSVLSNRIKSANKPDEAYQQMINNSLYYQDHPGKQSVNNGPLLQTVVFSHDLFIKTKKDIVNESLQTVSANKKKTYDKGFYFGLLAGMDISNVKLQRTSHPGYSTGVLVGYMLNRWKIESGMMWDQKSYYSDGKYFNPKLWPYWDIKNVDGVCKMIEVPINIKYSFSQSAKNSLYVLSGVSSYIMKKESYNYTYQAGSMPPAEGYKTYLNSTINWLSVWNVGIGYSSRIFRSGTIHIEPYARIPFHGVGIGKLPINSFGINLSLTRPIKK